jgi:hypothetical protein
LSNPLSWKLHNGRAWTELVTQIGNERILEEFFTNKLEKILYNVLISHPAMENLCANVIIKYGESPICYDYDGILSSQEIFINAMLNSNCSLVNMFLEIDNLNNNKLLFKKDEFGIPSLFWLKYLGYDILNSSFSQVPLLKEVNSVVINCAVSVERCTVTNVSSSQTLISAGNERLDIFSIILPILSIDVC